MFTSLSSRVTISFDPAVDEERKVLQVIADTFATARFTGSPIDPVRAVPAGGGRTVEGWTPLSMYVYVAALTPVARTVLLAMLATSPCPTTDAQQVAALSSRRYAEAHASLEEALLVVPEIVRLPFDVVDGCFTFDEEVAQLLGVALDRLDDEAGHLSRAG